MTLASLKRNNLRYIMFRLKAGQTDKRARLTGKDLQKLLTGWGRDVSVVKAKTLLAEIKTHYEAQLYFTGWENFAAEVTNRKTGAVRGTNKSWDIGMVDGEGTPESQILNIARMVNRPHKWFLFGKAFTEVISTRGLENSVTTGLDYYARQGFASANVQGLRDVRLYPDVSGQGREFDYRGIYERVAIT